MQRLKQKYFSESREDGVFLLLMAAILSGLIAWGMVMTVNALVVKVASSQLRTRTLTICNAVARRGIFNVDRDNSLTVFQSQVQSSFATPLFPGGSTRLIRAWLIMPTVPGVALETFGSGFSDENPRYLGVNHVFGAGGVGPAGLGLTSCADEISPQAGDPDDFLFFGTVSPTDTVSASHLQELTDRFPASFWNNTDNAGNTSACVLEAEVATFFNGWLPAAARNPVVSSIVALSKPVRANLPTDNSVPGLVLAVAPHMTTSAADGRFIFPDNISVNPVPAAGSPLNEFTNTYEYDPFDLFQEGALAADLSVSTAVDFDTGGVNTNADLMNMYLRDAHLDAASSGGFRRRASSGGSADLVYTPERISPYQQSAHWYNNEPAVVAGSYRLTDLGGERYTECRSQYASVADCPVGSGTPNPTPFLVGGIKRNANTPSDYEEIMTACMNPAVLVRNMFLTTIVELASRHGQLRAGTEILLVGTQHQMPFSSSDYALGKRGGRVLVAPRPNNPVRIVPFGRDLVRPGYDSAVGDDYQIPYVAYYSQHLHGEMGVAKGGWISPWEKINLAGSSVNFRCKDGATNYCPHHALLASQLRICHQLYRDIISRPFPETLDESALVPPAFYNRFLNLYDSSQLYISWDQDWPWGIGSGVASHGSVNAAELVSVLGTIQSCPYRQYLGNLGGTESVCQKPIFDIVNSNPSDDLRPDYEGLLLYLRGENAFQGLRSPGLFPFNNTASGVLNGAGKAVGGGVRTPEQAATLGLSVFDSSNDYRRFEHSLDGSKDIGNVPLLIVTHRPPTVSAPIGDHSGEFVLSNLLDDPLWENRPVTVVFIPTTLFDHNRANAFRNAVMRPNSVDRIHNSFYLLSPYGEFYDREADETTPRSVSEATIFRDYWLELIKPGSWCDGASCPTHLEMLDERSIYHRAEDIFNNVLTTLERKF